MFSYELNSEEKLLSTFLKFELSKEFESHLSESVTIMGLMKYLIHPWFGEGFSYPLILCKFDERIEAPF